jgi:hypothetical protein
MYSFLAGLKNVFCWLKGQSPLKNVKIGGNIEFLKAYRLIQLTSHPPPLPLDSTFKTFGNSETSVQVLLIYPYSVFGNYAVPRYQI